MGEVDPTPDHSDLPYCVAELVAVNLRRATNDDTAADRDPAGWDDATLLKQMQRAARGA